MNSLFGTRFKIETEVLHALEFHFALGLKQVALIFIFIEPHGLPLDVKFLL